MPELNKANRQVCDVDIRNLKTKTPFLFFSTANTTTAGITGDSVYARAKGVNRIPFANPIQGTMTIEAQVYPFKLFALFSDGTISTDAAYPVRTTVTCSTAGKLPLAVTGGTVVTGTVFVFPVDKYGDEDSIIPGTYASNEFTATTTADIAVGSTYAVGFIVNRNTGVKRVSFNNEKLPRDYYITQSTLDKDEEGTLTPFLMTAYKAYIQRNFELSFSSDGDPATVTLNFDLMEDKDGNFLDMTEITAELGINVSGDTDYIAKLVTLIPMVLTRRGQLV